MSTIHLRDQLATSLDKKEARLVELEKQAQLQKENLNGEIQALYAKISTL